MVLVDLNNKKTLIFDTTNTDKIKEANFIIHLSNNVVYSYSGSINVGPNNVIVELPILKDIITKEIQGECYLELQDNDNRYYRLSKDAISFIFAPIVQLNFNSNNYEIEAEYKNRNEIALDKKSLKLTPVLYKETEKRRPLRREIALSLIK